LKSKKERKKRVDKTLSDREKEKEKKRREEKRYLCDGKECQPESKYCQEYYKNNNCNNGKSESQG